MIWEIDVNVWYDKFIIKIWYLYKLELSSLKKFQMYGTIKC